MLLQLIHIVPIQRGVDYLEDRMTRDNFTVSCLHSSLKPSEKDAVMRDFRLGKSRVLISTDLIARGIDVQGVSVVINFDLPRNRENYIHRVGRSGRFGRKGLAINLVDGRDVRELRELQRFYETQIDPLPVDIKKYINNG